jgi:hypothetical protein
MPRPKSTGKATSKANKYADEGKPAKFSRIAGLRLNKVLDGLDSLAACARSKSMTYTPEQAAKISKTLRAGVESVERAYAAPSEGPAKERVAL